MVSDIKLTQEERYCSLWRKLEQHTAEQIESLRKQNDADLDATKTASMRGRISELKKLRQKLGMETSLANVVDG